MPPRKPSERTDSPKRGERVLIGATCRLVAAGHPVWIRFSLHGPHPVLFWVASLASRSMPLAHAMASAVGIRAICMHNESACIRVGVGIRRPRRACGTARPTLPRALERSIPRQNPIGVDGGVGLGAKGELPCAAWRCGNGLDGQAAFRVGPLKNFGTFARRINGGAWDALDEIPAPLSFNGKCFAAVRLSRRPFPAVWYLRHTGGSRRRLAPGAVPRRQGRIVPHRYPPGVLAWPLLPHIRRMHLRHSLLKSFGIFLGVMRQGIGRCGWPQGLRMWF